MPPTYHHNQDMWDCLKHATLFFITTNASINEHGKLVMGRGIAQQAAERYPLLPKIWGKRIASLQRQHGGQVIYGLILPPKESENRLAAFQVKWRWQDMAEMRLITYAIGLLTQRLRSARDETQYIALPFPGVGNGRLPKEVVKPWLDLLPSVVHVYSRDE